MDAPAETDDYVKDYDHVLVTRVMAFLRPYAPLVALVVLALALSTLAELAAPLIQQRLIDRYVIPGRAAVHLDAAARASLSPGARRELDAFLSGAPEPGGPVSGDGPRVIGGMFFAGASVRARLSGAGERELREAGVLDGEKWYVYKIGGGNAPPDGEAGAPFVSDGRYAALRLSDLAALDAAERARVRAGDLAALPRAALALLAALLVIFAATFAHTCLSSLIGQRVMKNIRVQMYNKTIRQSSAFLARNPTGSIVSRLTGDVETINDFFTSVMPALLKDVSIMAGALVTLVMLSPRLAAITILCMPPVIAVTAISRVKARGAFRDQRAATSELSGYLSERLSGTGVVQLFRAEDTSRAEFAALGNRLLGASLREIYIFGLFRPSVEFMATFTTAAVIAVGGLFALRLSVSLGVLIAFINLIAMFYAPVMDIAEKYTMLQSAMAGSERVFFMLDIDERIPDTGTRGPPEPGGDIAFDGVRFSYEKGEDVLRGLSFTARGGRMTAITGLSGAGKTTITNLISRLWDVDAGAIRLGGVDAREMPLDVLRGAALPVQQDVFLFSFTVAENIALGLPLSREEIERAAKAAGAHEFVTRLPRGYDTRLSEGAANISQGERQLLSFARVIAHDPAILILDEATGSIDSETEARVQAGLGNLLRGRTSIVIAHRLSTIRGADKILVLRDGRLAEEGRHDELVAQDGIYAGLYRLQAEEGARA